MPSNPDLDRKREEYKQEIEKPLQKDSFGPINFTGSIDPSTITHEDGVQLRADAIEENDYYPIPHDLYTELVSKFDKQGKEIIRQAICENEQTVLIEIRPLSLRFCKSRSDLPSQSKKSLSQSYTVNTNAAIYAEGKK
ncbi:unnamed protein product [Didymodactylos carnosus]|uniref:Uncharacterized protein n=1 Tax=Didymodactylos carnosus TaxID=1234261 RepID=A0A815QEM2_9BILA|nr:unnamed protein product [Didymodactylos carnosus]CAF1462268.1 unnamed protein product [Didymodactylos carnosus]CAF4081185.1 unnamed protein product [Didymodactylos carnosus]CAF4332302.1 unnamed protein product [Didymodactylos carnosus]